MIIVQQKSPTSRLGFFFGESSTPEKILELENSI
jgi:hypothetical protein